MKVAFLVTRSDSVGGASIHVRDLSVALRKAGHEALVILGGTGEVTDRLEEAGVPFVSLKCLVREIDCKKDFLAILEVRKALRRIAPDILSTHTSKAGFIGRIAAWSCGIPVIYTPHCWSFVDGFPKAKLYLWAERFAAPFGNRVVAVSEDERQTAIARKVVSADRILTIHNGMPDIQATLHADASVSPPRLCMIGRTEQQKDHPALLRALGGLKNLEWTLDLVGDGPRRLEIERLTAELGLEKRVRFLGYRTDIADVLSTAQLYLLISNWESFPRSILEAMRAGLPVIASDVGGVRESVIDGVTGFVVSKGNPTCLADRLQRLVENPDLRKSMGDAGRDLYARQFSFDRMLDTYLNLYEELMRRKRR